MPRRREVSTRTARMEMRPWADSRLAQSRTALFEHWPIARKGLGSVVAGAGFVPCTESYTLELYRRGPRSTVDARSELRRNR